MSDPDFPSKQDRYTRVARTVYGALLTDTWQDIDKVFLARLSEEERCILAGALMRTMDPKNVSNLSEAVLRLQSK